MPKYLKTGVITIVIMTFLFFLRIVFSVGLSIITEIKENVEENEYIESFDNKSVVYCPQNIKYINYNNISANSTVDVLASDSAYYYKQGREYYFYELTEIGEVRLFSHNYCENLQLYGDRLYFNDTNSLVEYNLNSNIKKDILTFKDYWIDKYYILNGYVYIKTSDSKNKTGELKVISVDTKESLDIAQNVFSVGVINENILYITQNELSFSIYKYFPGNNSSVLLGQFTLDIKYGETIKNIVNYTSAKIILITDFRFVIYDFDANTVNYQWTESEVFSAVAFENNIFFDCLEENHTALNKLQIDTGELQKIAVFDGFLNLSVYSDENVYVSSNCFEGIRKYSLDGTYEDVYKKRTIF